MHCRRVVPVEFAVSDTVVTTHALVTALLAPRAVRRGGDGGGAVIAVLG